MNGITIRPAVELSRPITTIDRYRLAADATKDTARTMTVSEYAARYATIREIVSGTARQYVITAAIFERWAGRPVLLTELEELLVSAWLRDYAVDHAPDTVRSKRNGLLALWRAAAEEYLCEPPSRRVRTARTPWTPREAWTVDEVRQLLAAASTLPRWHSCGLRRRDWWPLAIRLAWDTALRWGDLVRLRVDHLDGDRFAICQSKTGRPSSGRLNASTVAAIEESLSACPRAVLVPWPRSHETFTDQVRRLVAKSGVSPGSWKWLRRGSGSNVEGKSPGRGMAARVLGHSPTSRIAEINYIVPSIVAASAPTIQPDDLEVATAPESGREALQPGDHFDRPISRPD